MTTAPTTAAPAPPADVTSGERTAGVKGRESSRTGANQFSSQSRPFFLVFPCKLTQVTKTKQKKRMFSCFIFVVIFIKSK